ncbi:MAG: Dihydrodipicolinate reductase [uncultured bacterium]|nr:MAG: Dihydrodipicolinate reductase [uncultured bacterium]
MGASLLLRLAQEIAKYFPADIDIIETHHKTKKDKPSGTALYLANRLPNSTVHSIRSALCCGEHTVIFNTPQEKLTLTHQVHNREAFAQGALAAAHFIAMQPPGLYGMDNLFSSK